METSFNPLLIMTRRTQSRLRPIGTLLECVQLSDDMVGPLLQSVGHAPQVL